MHYKLFIGSSTDGVHLRTVNRYKYLPIRLNYSSVVIFFALVQESTHIHRYTHTDGPINTSRLTTDYDNLSVTSGKIKRVDMAEVAVEYQRAAVERQSHRGRIVVVTTA